MFNDEMNLKNMILAKEFIDYLKKKEHVFLSGVPCSILETILRNILDDSEIIYIPAVRENVALGIASGAYLSGKKSAILIQNSGLGNIVNSLTSFNLIYKIPVLMFITWRGFEGKDAPEHVIMGEKTVPMLDMLGIPNRVLSCNYREDIDWAVETMKTMLIPVALILKKGMVE